MPTLPGAPSGLVLKNRLKTAAGYRLSDGFLQINAIFAAH
jgi:hypothetical protein